MALYAFEEISNEQYGSLEYGVNTNVARFRAAWTRNGFYYASSAPTSLFKRIVVGSFGTTNTDLDTAYADLCASYRDGDQDVDIVGVGRGALLAMALVAKLHVQGIQLPKSAVTLVKNPQIRFLGLWDALGIADLQSLPGVQHCFHALALDERRITHSPIRISGAYEVWFRGGHGDIAGGHRNPKRSSIALRWMMKKALKLQLPIDDEKLKKVETRVEITSPVMTVDFGQGPWRTVRPGDLVHHTVIENTDSSQKSQCNPGVPTDVETKEQEAGATTLAERAKFTGTVAAP